MTDDRGFKDFVIDPLSDEQFKALVAALPPMTIDDKAVFVHYMGLVPAYCPQCMCTAGSPYCHPEITNILVNPPYRHASDEEKFRATRCPSPCPADTDSYDPDDDEEEGA